MRGLIIGELELEYKNSSKEDPESVRSHFDKGLDYQYIYHSPNHKEQIKFKITRRDLLDNTEDPLKPAFKKRVFLGISKILFLIFLNELKAFTIQEPTASSREMKRLEKERDGKIEKIRLVKKWGTLGLAFGLGFLTIYIKQEIPVIQKYKKTGPGCS